MKTKQRIVDWLILAGILLGTGCIFAGAWILSAILGLPGWVLPTALFILFFYLTKRFLDEACGINNEN